VKHKNLSQLIIFLLVCLIHLLLLFALDFSAAPPPPAPRMRIVQLVNIAEQGASPPSPQPASKPAAPSPVPQKTATGEAVKATEEKIAEQFEEDEDGEPEPLSGAATEQTERSESKARGENAASRPPQNGEAAAYIKKNFDYIQRRIKDKLVYPAQAKRMGVQGKTEIIFTLHADGTVSAVSVRLSSGNELLDKAAVDAVYAAAPFKPPPPSQARLVVPVVFSLR
jgi:protein TonB